jgi:hypothetical protein
VSTVAPGATLWNPVPAVNIGGTDIAPGLPGDGSLAGLVALGGLRVTWGTDQPMDQAPPSTAAVSIMDFTRTWATDTDRIGVPVVLSWSTTVQTKVFFRGRVTALQLRRVHVARPGGGTVPATRIDLDCSSLEVDLANRYPTETSWPAETVVARAARIAAYCTGVADGGVFTRDYWATAQAAAVDDPSSTSIRDLLLQLFNSTGGDRMIYSPDKRTYEWLGRARADARTLQRLWIGGAAHPREGMGAWVGPDQPFFTTSGVDSGNAGALFLDADVLEYDEGLSRQASSRINRSSVTSLDAGAADAQVTTVRVDPAAYEWSLGTRSVTLDSLHNFNPWAALLAEDLLAMATQEGAAWRPGRMRWDVRKTGGFRVHQQVSQLLRGCQAGYAVSINGSFLSAYNIRPVFRVTGGVITYEGARTPGWVVDFDLAGFATSGGGNASPTPTLQHAITFEEIDDGSTANTIAWYDGDHPHGLHESVTFEDLGFVGRGLAAATIGPNTGWDRP